MNNNKLSISHIAPYLPYGLKCHAMGEHEDNDDVESAPKKLTVTGTYTDSYQERYIEATYLGDKFEISFNTDFFPLLLPMSALYEALPDGSVPIVELAKIAVDYGWKLGKHYCDGLYIDVAESIYDIFFYNESHKVFELANIYGIGGIAPNQLDLFTYLFEHHFDVFSLIDNGLAIDKSKIK